VQEALTNVARHAQASEVTVNLAITGELVTLAIADNGSGFSVAGSSRGMGLRGMRERSTALGGELALQSGPDGTRLTLDFPAG
jgi:signal transduction histidine kinase